MIKKIVLSLAISASLMVLDGCSVLGVGKNDFSCPGKPHGVSCASTREMYEATNNGAVPAPVTEEEVEEMAKKGEHVSTVKGVQQDTVVMQQNSLGERSTINTTLDKDGKVVSVQEKIVDNYVAPALPDKPIPIRTPSVVMRIWIPAWEDTSGNLNATGLIYTEIEPRRWIWGDNVKGTKSAFNPLEKHVNLNK